MNSFRINGKFLLGIILSATLLSEMLGNVYALVPLENLLTGELSEEEKQKQSNTLDYVFQSSTSLEKYNNPEGGAPEFAVNRDQFINYRGFIAEGEGLKQYCKKSAPIFYQSSWPKDQAKRFVISTLQFITLDLTIRALASFAKKFEFTADEYVNMTNHLVGNYCSPNISIISLKELKKNMLNQFKNGNFQLPDVKNNIFFPSKMKNVALDYDAQKREFFYTTKIFRNACSWGGRADDLRLMTSLLKNPFIFSFVIRQLTNRKIYRSPMSQRFKLVYDDKTIKVGCESFICRKMNNEKWKQNFPRAVGSFSIEDDLKRLYCQEFRTSNLYQKTNSKQINKWMTETTLDDHKLYGSQMIALLTGIPDFFVRAKTFNQGKEFSRYGVDQAWDKWAESSRQNFSKEIFYEESLTLDLIKNSAPLALGSTDFEVNFDVNLGEFDRLNEKKGKVKAKFDLKLDKSFLARSRYEWRRLDPSQAEKRKKLVRTFRRHLEKQLEAAKNLFILSPWTQDIGELIAQDLLNQLGLYSGDFFKNREHKWLNIPISFRYGPFALKYIHYRFKNAKELEL